MFNKSNGKIKLYLTGYGPFLDHKDNPSQLLVQNLEKINREGKFPSFDNSLCLYDARILDVDVEYVKKTIWELKSKVMTDNESFHLLIHFGLDGSIANIDLENKAKNFICDYKKYNGKIIDSDKQEDQVFECKLDLELIVKELSDKNIKVSQDAGTYLCNFIYYMDNYYICRNKKNVFTLFIHVPETYNLSVDQTTDIFLGEILKEAVKQIKGLTLFEDINCLPTEEMLNEYINSYEVV